MIEQVANQPEVEDWREADELAADIVEHDAPRLHWFECPVMSRGDMLGVIKRQKDLDGRAVNLFKNAWCESHDRICSGIISGRTSTILAPITFTRHPIWAGIGTQTGVPR
jgi:hypothetical protein